MNLKRLMIVLGAVILVTVIAFSWGCQNQPTAPVANDTQQSVKSAKTRGTGSCTSGSINGSFSNANFGAGLGWSTGSDRTISYSGSCSACNTGPGVYGWLQNPLVEYYVGNGGGTSKGSYSCNGRTYTVYTNTRTNAPSIEGTKTFTQYNCGGSNASPVDMGCHFNAWRNKGLSVGSQNLQVVWVESWSSTSGSYNISVPNSNWYTLWIGSGSASLNCGGGGGSTTTTTSGGGSTTTSGGGGSYTISVGMRGTSGSEHVNLLVGGSKIASWTLSTSMKTYTASTSNSGGIGVQFDNDASGRDVQVDCIWLPNGQFQAENQSYNTGVWQNSKCGGSNSEWLHCNGMIGFSAYR